MASKELKSHSLYRPKSQRSHEGWKKNVLYKKNASWSGGN